MLYEIIAEVCGLVNGRRETDFGKEILCYLFFEGQSRKREEEKMKGKDGQTDMEPKKKNGKGIMAQLWDQVFINTCVLITVDSHLFLTD